MNKNKDWCTSFPETWYRWKTWYSWEKVYIGDCCEIHDEDCSTKRFLKCMKERRIVGFLPIVTIASTVCLIKYGKV